MSPAGTSAGACRHRCPTCHFSAPPDFRDAGRPALGIKDSMPKSITEIRSLARSHTRTALNVLVGVMRNTKATAPARIAAANAILDRGWGKATQPVGNDGDAFELIHRIERVIV